MTETIGRGRGGHAYGRDAAAAAAITACKVACLLLRSCEVLDSVVR